MVTTLKLKDSDVDIIAETLERFEAKHPRAKIIVYRYNPASIRIKIEDDVFGGLTRGARHDYAMSFLGNLPDEILAQLSILLCLVPGEYSLMAHEFNDPASSQL